VVSTAQAAEYLGVSQNTIRNYVNEGRLTRRQVGLKLLKFDPDELDSFVGETDQ